MPFKLIKRGKNKGKYIIPSGRIYTEKQMKAYFATQGFKRAPRKIRRSSK